MSAARIDKAVVSGVFSLDGQDFDVDNNVWLVGDDDEVLVIDAPHDAAPIVEAIGGRRVTAIATAATTSPALVVGGVLTEACTTFCGGTDQPSFKGAFVRNLGELDRTLPGRPYRTFLQAQVTSLWATDHTSLDQYGLNWAGPMANLDAATQHSALDAYTAALP